MSTSDDVVIVGAGAIGLCSALALLDAGRGVRVLDAGRVGGGSSHGNCGTITPSHAAPMAAPGTIGKALKWMLTPDAPLYVKPRLDPALWRWLLGFASHCNPRDWRRAMHARAAILGYSRRALPEWISRYGLDCEFAEDGVDFVFRDARALTHAIAELPALAALEIAADVIDGTDYQRDEPAVRAGLAGVIRFPGDARLRPDRYVAGLAHAVREAGGVIEDYRKVMAIDDDERGVSVQTTEGRVHARDVLMATGAWSALLASASGLSRIPVQPGKGYSITYDTPALVPRRPMVLYERSVCVTAWDSGFRLGSTMEFSGYDTSLNRQRLDALERGAREYLQSPVGPVKREEWYGWRPVSVDDVPIIGAAPGHRNVWIATGHGMLGISMSTGTGALVADLMCSRPPAFDPHPYSPDRFA